MCGIAGFTGFEDRTLIKNMCDSISHRGPDDFGFFIDKDICLGSRRLSIIDLKTGKQPIHNENEDVWIVFNGEIYNYRELRENLEGKHKFYTNSDTEVIVHCYEEYGEDFIKKLDGMFAFAIYDSKKRILILGRDRSGKKPLYFTTVNGNLIFASEIKAILQSENVKREIDLQSLHDYLSFRYVPEPRTLFKNIMKLMPGHFMVWQNNKFSIKKYWDFEFKEENYTEQYCINEFKRLLTESVRKRLISDVPLGVYLSGGIDSTTVVAIMNKLKESIKTFSIGYGIEGFKDELENAKKVSEYFDTEHHEFIIDFNPMDVLPKVIWHMDEPVADPSALPVYLLSQMAKKYVTVVLVGEGADENLAGYEQYKFMLLMNKLNKLPKFVKSNITRIIKITPNSVLNNLFQYMSSLGEEGKKRLLDYVSSYDNSYKDYAKINFIFTEEEKKNFYSQMLIKNNFEPSDRFLKEFFNNGNNNLLNKMLLTDNKTFLSHLLLKLDKTTMAHGVEGRAPYVDTNLVEFCSRMPQNMKLRSMTDKYILRKSVSYLLPKFVFKRKKQRFFVPIHYWLEKILKDHVEEIFSKQNVQERKFFNYEFINKMLSNYQKSKLYYGRQLWTLLTFELWCRIFIDNEKIPKKF